MKDVKEIVASLDRDNITLIIVKLEGDPVAAFSGYQIKWHLKREHVLTI